MRIFGKLFLEVKFRQGKILVKTEKRSLFSRVFFPDMVWGFTGNEG